MNPDEFLFEFASGHPSAAAHWALVEAVRQHIETGASLDAILGLQGSPSPASQVRRLLRDAALRRLWQALPADSNRARAQAAANLLDHVRRHPKAPESPLLHLAKAVIRYANGATLGADYLAQLMRETDL